MKQTDKKRSPSSNQPKRSAQTDNREKKLQPENANQSLRAKGTESKKSAARPDSSVLGSQSKTGMEHSEVYENLVVHYMDDIYRSEEASQNPKVPEMTDTDNESKDKQNECSKDLEKGPRDGREEESDSETVNDSVSSNGDSQLAEDDKVDGVSGALQRLEKKDYSGSRSRAQKVKSENGARSAPKKGSLITPKKSTKSNRELSNPIPDSNSKNVKVHPKPSSESSEGAEDKHFEETKEMEISDEALHGGQSVGSDDEKVDAEKHMEHEEKDAVDQKIGEMEVRIVKLEEELREVAALEISLYSVVPEHGSSAHKVHTPARRLSRLYIHACKHWSQDKRATVARNSVSGLVLIAKSCGNDVPRLTFWWSNSIVLREIISQAFGNSCKSTSLTRIIESNGAGKKIEGKSPSLKWNISSGSKQPSKNGLLEFIDDWQETRTYTSALEKVESWIFSRIVESIWWQTLTPNMQSVSADTSNTKTIGRLLGPALGDQQQGNVSINLWKIAFYDAFKRLCPVRSAGHECGCLPVMARMVMEQCIARLDVAMFNAILRESAHEIPTDPVSDPIVDSRVLPIPAGNLSFGSGAQLKNSVSITYARSCSHVEGHATIYIGHLVKSDGNDKEKVGSWSRWLTDWFGMDTDDPVKEENAQESMAGGSELKCFHLLNALSDLLMLPKDMIMDRSIRAEVCPSISLSLLKRILCNFTPDEFCPDPVPGTVLEAINAECIIERRLSGEASSSFPYTAAPVVYQPPSSADVAEKVSEARVNSQMVRSASAIQRKGYTSDEELEELGSPLTSIIDKLPSCLTVVTDGNGDLVDREGSVGFVGPNARYELLREVWSS